LLKSNEAEKATFTFKIEKMLIENKTLLREKVDLNRNLFFQDIELAGDNTKTMQVRYITTHILIDQSLKMGD